MTFRMSHISDNLFFVFEIYLSYIFSTTVFAQEDNLEIRPKAKSMSI